MKSISRSTSTSTSISTSKRTRTALVIAFAFFAFAVLVINVNHNNNNNNNNGHFKVNMINLSSSHGVVAVEAGLLDSVASFFGMNMNSNSNNGNNNGKNKNTGIATHEVKSKDKNGDIPPERQSSPTPPPWEPEHAEGVSVVNFADHSLPKVEVRNRWVDLFNGMEFDDIQRDTPDELRPPGIIMFHGHKQCPGAASKLHFKKAAEEILPARERLAIYKYDMDAAPKRAWYKFTPEMDLASRFNAPQHGCPSIAFVPRSCNGFTKWCTQPHPTEKSLELVGCEDFVDSTCANDIKFWNGQGDWVEWVNDLIALEGEPQISPFLKTYREQGQWIRSREATTTMTHMRNTFLAEAFPAFTKTGFTAMPTPAKVQDFLIDFWKKNQHRRRTESWEGDATQLSFHETPTSFVNLDSVAREKEKFANEYLKPMVEAWSGVKPLELTSFYGLREYKTGNWLRSHIDRIDTHVLSVTMTVGKVNESNMSLIEDPNELAKLKPWPLEVTTWDGTMVRHNHTSGQMILYESSKLVHGRPYHNEGGGHIGAFCHFKPKHMHGKEAGAWDEITQRARTNMNLYVKNGAYRSTPTVEPRKPVYSARNIGAGSRWKHLDDREEEKDESMPVTFKNKAERSLEVYWDGRDVGHSLVHQGKIAPGTSYNIRSYVGHKFFWSEEGEETPLPGGKFEVEKGRRVYVYSSDNNGDNGPWVKTPLQES